MLLLLCCVWLNLLFVMIIGVLSVVNSVVSIECVMCWCMLWIVVLLVGFLVF